MRSIVSSMSPTSEPVIGSVLLALQGGAKTATQISRDIGVSTTQSIVWLERLEKSGAIALEERAPGSKGVRRWRLHDPVAIHERLTREIKVPSMRVVLATAAACLLMESLEMLSRLGICQFGEVTDLVRERSFGEKSRFSMDDLSLTEATMDAVKRILTGFDPSASHSILSHLVDPRPQNCWALRSAMRHRLAWDRTPEGSFGVNFDEPLSSGLLQHVVVHSSLGWNSDEYAGMPSGYAIAVQFPLELVESVAIALEAYARLLTLDFGVLLELLQSGVVSPRDRQPLNPEDLAQARQMLLSLSDRLSGRPAGSADRFCLDAERATSLAQSLRSAVSYPDGAVGSVLEWNPGNMVRIDRLHPGHFSGLVPSAFVPKLPDSCCVAPFPQGYQVLAKCEDPHRLLVLSQSHSLQTAMIKGLNAALGAPARNTRI